MIRAGSMLSWPAEQYPNKVAVKFEGEEMTFLQVNERINRLANGLMDLGLKRGTAWLPCCIIRPGPLRFGLP